MISPIQRPPRHPSYRSCLLIHCARRALELGDVDVALALLWAHAPIAPANHLHKQVHAIPSVSRYLRRLWFKLRHDSICVVLKRFVELVRRDTEADNEGER